MLPYLRLPVACGYIYYNPTVMVCFLPQKAINSYIIHQLYLQSHLMSFEYITHITIQRTCKINRIDNSVLLFFTSSYDRNTLIKLNLNSHRMFTSYSIEKFIYFTSQIKSSIPDLNKRKSDFECINNRS